MANKEEKKRQEKTRQGKTRKEKIKYMNKRREDVEEMRTKNKNRNRIDM